MAGMTDEEFAKTVNHGRHSKMLITMVAVYKHPKEFPKSYVARLHIMGKNRCWPSPKTYIARDTLEEVRAAIPQGMERTWRTEKDDPCIVGGVSVRVWADGARGRNRRVWH